MQAERLFLQLHLASLDSGHIQDIVDQCQQMIRKFIRSGQILHRRRILGKLALRQCQHADDTIHRSTDLMGHPGEERGLGLTDFLRLFQLFLIFGEPLVYLCNALKKKADHRIPLHIFLPGTGPTLRFSGRILRKIPRFRPMYYISARAGLRLLPPADY